MELRFPKNGVSDAGSFDEQAPDTTRRAKNARWRRDFDGREGGGQRAGQVKHTAAAVVAATKIARLDEVVHDNPQTTYTALGSSVTVENSTATPGIQDCRAAVLDRVGNRYFLDGNTTIVKTNDQYVVQWKIVLPASSPNALVRTLAVDDAFRVYAGESDGVDPETAKLWCYEQIEDKKTQLLWELTPGYRTEWIKASGTTLVVAQNDSVNWRSVWAVYAGLGVPNPTLVKRVECPYPVNHVDVSPKDGSIGTSHEPDTQRGQHPGDLKISARSVDQDPKDFISNYASRIWARWDARDLDGNGTFNSAYENGDAIDGIGDGSGQARDWQVPSGVTGARLAKGAIAGQDALYFDGTNYYLSEAPFSQDRAFKNIQRSAVPLYTGAQFVAVLAFRIPPDDSTMRYLLGVNVNDASSAASRTIVANRYVSSSLPGTARRGNVVLYEDSTGSGSVADGTDDYPHSGVWDDDGLLIISWVYDGGLDDVTGTPTRSCWRINGRPQDRWHSNDFAALLVDNIQCALGWGVTATGTVYPSSGWSKMLGYFLGGIVLSDWETTSTSDISSPFTRQRLIEMPNYPDTGWSANGATELEKLEGWMAHSWGAAHKLPAGYFNRLESNGATPGTAAVANSTATIAGRTYTWKTTLTPTANEVLRGATGFVSLQNLMHAMNGTGVAGTDYAADTVAHATVRAVGVVIESGASDRTALYVQSRNGNGATFACAVGGSSAYAWDNANAISSSSVATNTDIGHFPHPYYLTRTPTAAGGPPSGTYGSSVSGALTLPSGMFVKWDGASGKAKNVLVTNGPGFAGIGVGGVGYCARFLSDGSFVTAGPRVATSTEPAIVADPIDVRRVTDDGTSFSTTPVSSGAWEYRFGSSTSDAFAYHYPRLDVDFWDNVYVPVFNTTEDKSLVVLAKNAGSGGSFNGRTLAVVTSLTDDPQAYAVAVDTEYPDFPSSFTDPRAERVVLATRKETASTTAAVWDLRLVSAATAAAAPRSIHRVAVCNGGLYEITSGGSPTTIDASAFSSSARFIDSCTIFGKWIGVDGQVVRLWDPRAASFGYLRSRSSGKVPPRPMLCGSYRKRVFLGRFSDNPHSFAFSAYDDIYGWDFDPQGDSPLPIAAVRSPLTTFGDFPDTLTAFASWKDDLAVFGGDNSIFIGRGDPGQGGQFDSAFKGIGIAFGRAHCWTPDGTLWFVTNQAELYHWAPGADPVRASRNVQRRLFNAIDFSTHRVELAYNPIKRHIRIMQFPTGAGDTLPTHFVLDLDTYATSGGGFWPDDYGATGIQPTAMRFVMGDGPSARVMLLGSRDGYVREESNTAKTDDGTRIDSEVLIGPLHDQGDDVEALYQRLKILLARDMGAARFELYVTAEPDKLGDPVVVGRLDPGWNTPSVRASGAWVGLMLAGSTGLDYWGLVRATIDGAMVARQRRRGGA